MIFQHLSIFNTNHRYLPGSSASRTSKLPLKSVSTWKCLQTSLASSVAILFIIFFSLPAITVRKKFCFYEKALNRRFQVDKIARRSWEMQAECIIVNTFVISSTSFMFLRSQNDSKKLWNMWSWTSFSLISLFLVVNRFRLPWIDRRMKSVRE